MKKRYHETCCVPRSDDNSKQILTGISLAKLHSSVLSKQLGCKCTRAKQMHAHGIFLSHIFVKRTVADICDHWEDEERYKALLMETFVIIWWIKLYNIKKVETFAGWIDGIYITVHTFLRLNYAVVINKRGVYFFIYLKQFQDRLFSFIKLVSLLTK